MNPETTPFFKTLFSGFYSQNSIPAAHPVSVFRICSSEVPEPTPAFLCSDCKAHLVLFHYKTDNDVDTTILLNDIVISIILLRRRSFPEYNDQERYISAARLYSESCSEVPLHFPQV